ncbi:MAG: PilW family protein [Gammaproteobacteria bacterium]|nr:PilW family protein [Gammaproteobacteria bacterium]
MKKQSGFTLIELMIAGFIGIFIMTGLMNLFITTNKSVTLSDSLSQNQETGRFAMDYLTKFIRRAGYSEDFTNFVPPIYLASGSGTLAITCTGTQADACAINNPTTSPATILGDRLSIPFSVGGNADDVTRSCTGSIVGGTANGPQNLVNVFWVSAETANLRELRCRTFNRDTNDWLDDPVSIINNVERFEFQVGIANSENEKFVSRYVSIDTLQADASININNIRSIRIAILTTSQDELDDKKVQSTNRKRTYNLLDAPVFSIEDSNLRNIFSNTIELPNMIENANI